MLRGQHLLHTLTLIIILDGHVSDVFKDLKEYLPCLGNTIKLFVEETLRPAVETPEYVALYKVKLMYLVLHGLRYSYPLCHCIRSATNAFVFWPPCFSTQSPLLR